MNLGEKIYTLRIQRGMSQGDLANALDVSRQSVSKWETGSAVPELEKLMKMSELFGVTLDELVGRAVPASETASPSAPPLSLPPRKIAGVVLLACAFLAFLVVTVAQGPSNGLLWAIPFALCGITCFVFKRHVGLWCAWALYLPFSFIPVGQIMRPDFALLIHLLVQVPLLIYTVWSFRQEKLQLTNRLKWILAAGYILWLIGFSVWLGLYFTPPELWDGFSVQYMLEVLSYPVFSFLLTVTLRVLKGK